MSHRTKAGEKTGIFGEWLTGHIKDQPAYRDLLIYYDHGDPQVHTNIFAIKGIYGERISRSTQLAQVDVMVANPNREILLLIEIEERFSSPKKLVGDFFTLLMCNRFYIGSGQKRRLFTITPETRLLVSGVIAMGGSKRDQLEKVIFPRIRDFRTPADAINPPQHRSAFRTGPPSNHLQFEELRSIDVPLKQKGENSC